MSLSSVFASLTGREQAVRMSATLPACQQPAGDLAKLLERPALRLVPETASDGPLGDCAEVRERISDILPGVNFDDQGRGVFRRTSYSVSFDTGCDDPVHTVRVQVTGGVTALPSLQRLIAKTGWKLVSDGSSAVAS